MARDPSPPVLLYVEDEILIQITLQAVLEDAGFSVLALNDGSQALAFLASGPLTLQGLITDVNLGDGPDGWDVARSARALVSDLPVIYLSSVGRRDWAVKGVCNSLMITKPSLPADAVLAMTSLLSPAPC